MQAASLLLCLFVLLIGMGPKLSGPLVHASYSTSTAMMSVEILLQCCEALLKHLAIFFGCSMLVGQCPMKSLPSACLSVYPSVHWSVCPLVHLSDHWSVHPVVCPSFGLSILLSLCPSVGASVHPSIHPSVLLSTHMLVCLFICLSIRPFVCLSVCLSLSFLKIGSLVFSDIVHDDSWP